MLVAQLALGTEFDAIGFGACDTVSSAFLDEIALEFSNGRQHMKEQASCGARGIDILIEHDQVDLFRLNFFCDVREITHRTGQSVKAGHEELVAFAHKGECACEFVAFYSTGSRLFLLEDFVTTRGLQFLNLRFKILPGGRNAGVSDFHVSKVFRKYGTALSDGIRDPVYWEVLGMQVLSRKV